MEKPEDGGFMDRKVSLWLVGLLAAFGLLGTIIFGNIAIHKYRGGTKAGPIGDVVLTLSTLPELYRQMFRNADNYLRIQDDHHQFETLGFEFSYDPGSRPEAGYLLLSRYDGDNRRPAAELWDLNLQKMIHEWDPDVNAIHKLAKLDTSEGDLMSNKNKRRMMFRQPVVLDDGSLVYKSRTPLVRVDACNALVFQNDAHVFHHSSEIDDEGYLWVPTRIEPTQIPFVDPVGFVDDAVTRISAEGDIVFQQSLSATMLKHGMVQHVYGRGRYMGNPIHLNDIQPVNSDGPHWKKGDVFLSLRTHSIIMLYRPSTDKIIWWQEGPWLHQHDVDILDDHRISVFNNNSIEAYGFKRALGVSDIMIYDFETDEVTSPWKAILEGYDFYSETEGLHQILPDGSLFLEEQNSGRIMQLDASGEMVWQYVNGAENGDVYRTGWSRLIDRSEGDAIARAIAQKDCNQADAD